MDDKLMKAFHDFTGEKIVQHKPKMVRPIMTAEARDALDRMCANAQARSLFHMNRSELILDMERDTVEIEASNAGGIAMKDSIISQQESAIRYFKRESHRHQSSRDYWLKVAGVSILINWGVLVYTAVQQGWFL